MPTRLTTPTLTPTPTRCATLALTLPRCGRWIQATLLASLLASTAARANELTLALIGSPVIDGRVNALHVDGETVYVGGRFFLVGPPTGTAVLIDLTTDELVPFPMVRGGAVFESVADGLGGWYLAGDFTEVGGLSRQGLAHVLSDGTVDPMFDPGVDGNVVTMLLHSGLLYLGGEFQTIGGEARDYAAALNPTTGAVASWAPEPDAEVGSLVVGPNGILVGGYFDNIGGKARERLAEVDASTGAANSLSVAINGTSTRHVAAIVVDGNVAYIGGRFTSVAGSARDDLAAVDLTTGLPTLWDPSPNREVLHLHLSGGLLYVGGRFTSVGATTRNRAASFDLSTGDLTAWNPDLDPGRVYTMADLGGTVAIGGTFESAGGAPRPSLVEVDATTGAATGFPQSAGGSVEGLAVHSNLLLVGGFFQTVGTDLRSHLAAFDISSGELLDWAPQLDSDVEAFDVIGDTLYVAGFFSNIDGSPRDGLAAVHTGTGALLPWAPDLSGDVYALEAEPGSIYVGGIFDEVGGAMRTNLAELDATTGLATPWSPTPGPADVLDLTISDDTVYVALENATSAQAFDRSSGVATAWSPVPEGGTAYCAHFDGTDVLLGGEFSELGGASRAFLGAVDPTDGLATSWNPGANDSVHDIAVAGSTVYVAGRFGSIGTSGSSGTLRGILQSGVGAVDRSTGATLWEPHTLGQGYAIAPFEGGVVVGGNFDPMGRGGLLIYSSPLFADGFENGSTSAWSFTTP